MSKVYLPTYEEVMDLFTDECIDNHRYEAKDGIEYTVKYLKTREQALATLESRIDAYVLHNEQGVRIEISWNIKRDLKTHVGLYTLKQIRQIMKRLDFANAEHKPITEGLYRIEDKRYDRSEPQ